VIKTQGRRGEVAAEVHSSVPNRFYEGLRLFALDENESRRELKLEALWPQKEWLVLKFKGIDSISDAETLLRCELQVPREERGQLEAGWTYVSELVGCKVFDGDREVGLLKDVEFGAGEAPLLIVQAGEKKHEIPYAEAYLKGVDPQQKEIRMQLPEGMLEVNAPLTEEEKRRQ
jgi:16S rRNA processing protein RimM